MKEGTHIPGAPACNEWEAQLTDALDGLLNPEEEARFAAHKLICPACAELYEEARKGRQWLEFLSPEPEPPEGLLDKILANTGPGRTVNGLPAAAGAGAVPAFVPPVWQQPGFLERMRTSAQPRLLMTAAMAFFSIALTLSVTGVDVRTLASLRPHAVRSYMERQLTMASVPIVRYYDHLRIVHEVEARVRELRDQSDSEDNGYGQPQEQMPATPGESRNRRHSIDRTPQRNDRADGSSGQRPRARRYAIPAENESTGEEAGEVLQISLESPIGSMQSRGYMVRRLERN